MSVIVHDSLGTDITAQLASGTYTTATLKFNKKADFIVFVTVASDAIVGNSNHFVLTTQSVAQSSVADSVRAITTV